MKKLLVVPLVLMLSTSGCAALDPGGRSVFSGGISLTANISNPVTPAMLSDVENGARVAVAGLLTYRRLCLAQQLDPSCRGTVGKIQAFTRPLCSKFANNRCTVGILADLRRFVRTNDQVNAVTAFNTARQLIASIMAAKQEGGVQ